MDKSALRKIKQEWKREATFSRESVVAEKRTVEVAFSSEEPVERFYGREVLGHKGSECDLKRLNNGAPLLLDHDPRCQVGVVERAWIDADGKGRATVRFSKSEDGEQVFQDVQDGIRTKISVGYRINAMRMEEEEDDMATYRATSWTPYEISLVSVPADDSVGVGRAETSNQTEIEITMRNNIMLNPDAPAGGGGAPAPAPKIEVNEGEVRKTEAKRCSEILALAGKFNVPLADAQRFIDGGKPVDEFRQHILESKPTQKPVDPDAGMIGMNRKEVERFSVLKAIRDITFNGRLDGLEKEVCESAMKHLKREIKDGAIVIPEDVMNPTHLRGGYGVRANNATNFGAGGATVATTLGPMIDLLRNKTVVAQAGATQLTGLTGNVAMPKHTGGATAYWVSETGALTDSESTFGQLVLTPHRLGATVPYSTQLLAQSSMSVEAFIRDDMMQVLAIAKDLAALHGTGAAGQPIGVQNTTGINATVTFGGAAVWADIVEFETGIAVDNADIGSMGFIVSSSTVGKWKTILRDSVAGSAYLIGDSGLVNGYPYYRTNQISGNIAFFGVWSQLVMASWSGIEVIVDPYALKKSGQVEITVNELCDIAVRQPLAFNVSTDSAAQ